MGRDLDMLMDFESPQDGVVRWVASQSANPALQALMKEAECDRKTRPSTPAQEPVSWTHPLTSATPSTSLPSSHSGTHNSVDGSYLLPLFTSTSSSLAPRASDPSRRAKPLHSAQRKPLSSSTSSANQLFHDLARPRSSSHSTALSAPSTSKPKHVPEEEEEPEAMAFIELLRDVSRQLDENSKKKQHLAARAKDKEREHSLGRSGFDNHRGSDAHTVSARPLIKTSSASAICPPGSTTRALERVLSASMSDLKPETHGRVTGSLGSPGVDLVSGKSTPTFLPSPNLNCDLKLAPAFRPPARPSDAANVNHSAPHRASVAKSTLDDGDSAMQDVIDLTETDTEWERHIPGSIPRANTTFCMQVDDQDRDDDVAMDMSFFHVEPTPQPRIAPPKPKPQPSQPHPSPPIQVHRTRSGPPPLGMRRAPQLQPSQYSASQASKSLSVPRFKPPLLANAAGSASKNGSGTKPATTTSNSRPVSRGGAAKPAVPKATARESQAADSSFDVSFGVDADALEEMMKAYD